MRVRVLAPGLLLAMALWLGGCAGSGGGSLTRYVLPGPDAPSIAGTAPEPHLLLLPPVELAPYLAVEGIVLQLDAVTLNAARDHQWAAPLEDQLRRGLRERLAVRLPDTRVVADSDGLPPHALVLEVDVDRFLGRPDGQAVAAGRWQLRTAQGELLAQRSFSAASPLQADGYPALVQALSRSWDQVAAEIAESIRQHR